MSYCELGMGGWVEKDVLLGTQLVDQHKHHLVFLRTPFLHALLFLPARLEVDLPLLFSSSFVHSGDRGKPSSSTSSSSSSQQPILSGREAVRSRHSHPTPCHELVVSGGLGLWVGGWVGGWIG